MCRCEWAEAQTHVQLGGRGSRPMRSWVVGGEGSCAGVWVGRRPMRKIHAMQVVVRTAGSFFRSA